MPPAGGCHGSGRKCSRFRRGAGAAGSGAAWRPTSCSAAWEPALALTCGASGSTRGASGCGDTEGSARGAASVRFGLRSPVPTGRGAEERGPAVASHPSPVLPQVVKGNGGSVSLESLDFFGNKEGAPQGAAEEGRGLAGAEEEVKQQKDGAGKKDGKRKRTAESGEGKRKKKKTRGICTHARVSGRTIRESQKRLGWKGP